MNYRVPFAELPWESCGPGARHKVRARDGQILRLVEYTNEVPPHWCERGHLGMILDGRLEIEFAGAKLVFGPGDGVDISSGPADRHRAVILTDAVTALFVEDAL